MDNIRGATLMAVAMTSFAVADTLMKVLTSQIATGQLILLVGIGGLVAVTVYELATTKRVKLSYYKDKFVLLRGLFEVLAVAGFISALSYIPLGTLSAMIQSVPLAVTLGAALFFREKVGWRRWFAITLGFLGVLIIVRPGGDKFAVESLFGLIGIIGLAGRDLVTRRISRSVSTFQLTSSAFLFTAIAGVTLLFVDGQSKSVSALNALLIATVICFVLLGTWTLITSLRVGDLSFVAPFRYFRLVAALIIGYIILNEVPDFWMIFGALIVVASGLYAFSRERKLADA